SQLGIPIVGVIENMSYVKCPDCGRKIDLFGPSNTAELAAHVGVPLLGRLPLRPELTSLADTGRLEEYNAADFEPIVERLVVLVPEEASHPVAP
ncbi:MAG: P-loop NTPase, partial [Chloroflexi bacterium]|nr:P-loop NTPase [Chloroflexota bacterium]